MSKISQYKERLEKFLNEENAFTNALGKVEEKTKVKRLHIFLGKPNYFLLPCKASGEIQYSGVVIL